METHLSVVEVAGETCGGAQHLVTRETGKAVRAGLAGRLEGFPPGSVLTLDFTGTGVIDFSCADECLAKLITRLVAGEFGEKYLLLAGLGASQRENVQVALERKKLAVIHVLPDRSWELLGAIKPYLRETLEIVMRRPGLSARDMAGLLALELTASSTRLINLHRQRLVTRRERTMEEGGREFVYAGLPGFAHA